MTDSFEFMGLHEGAHKWLQGLKSEYHFILHKYTAHVVETLYREPHIFLSFTLDFIRKIQHADDLPSLSSTISFFDLYVISIKEPLLYTGTG